MENVFDLLICQFVDVSFNFMFLRTVCLRIFQIESKKKVSDFDQKIGVSIKII